MTEFWIGIQLNELVYMHRLPFAMHLTGQIGFGFARIDACNVYAVRCMFAYTQRHTAIHEWHSYVMLYTVGLPGQCTWQMPIAHTKHSWVVVCEIFEQKERWTDFIIYHSHFAGALCMRSTYIHCITRMLWLYACMPYRINCLNLAYTPYILHYYYVCGVEYILKRHALSHCILGGTIVKWEQRIFYFRPQSSSQVVVYKHRIAFLHSAWFSRKTKKGKIPW